LLKVGAFRCPFERIRQNIRAPERPDAFWRQSLIGIGSRMQRPLAILVIGGIFISLFSLLIVVPALRRPVLARGQKAVKTSSRRVAKQ
jgi:hypothetical protein